jgi:alpha-galactosidase
MCPAFCMAVDVRKEGIDWDLYRRLLAQWRELADFFLGDYYPLTPYSLGDDAWMAWQFHVAEQDAGAVQAFRHGQALAETGTFRLHGLDPLGEYVVKDTEANVTRLVNGRQLVEEGLAIAIAIRPGAALVTYRKR